MSASSETFNLANENDSKNYAPTTGIREAMDDPNSSFTAVFGDAYTFRSLLEFINVTSSSGTFVFGKDYITYIQGAEPTTILNDFTVDPNDIIEYQYDSIYHEILVKLETNSIRSITRSVKKKDQLKICKVSGDESIYMEIVGGSSGTDDNANLGILRPIRVAEIKEYSVDDYERSESDPNCRVMTSSFCGACTSFQHIGERDVEIRGYQTGITISSSYEGSTAGKIFRFGRVSDEELAETSQSTLNGINPIQGNNGNALIIVDDDNNLDNKVPSLKISVATMKVLSKIGGLFTNGMVKIYLEKGRPMKLLVNVGEYGKLRIYVREDN